LNWTILQFYMGCTGRVHSCMEGGIFKNLFMDFGDLICQSVSVWLFFDWSTLQFYIGCAGRVDPYMGGFLKSIFGTLVITSKSTPVSECIFGLHHFT